MKVLFEFFKCLMICLLVFVSIDANAQVLQDEGNQFRKLDTICFKYSFKQGDTLTYNVISKDSIVINYGKPLVKMRSEIIRVVCDSIGKNGHYYLTQVLLGIKSTEQSGGETASRNKSDWTGRKAWFEIDSVGKRYRYGVDDTTKLALTPGGAFQPFLFLEIGQSCKAMKESWIVEALENIPENGVPVPVIKQSSLMRADTLLDTLGRSCKRFHMVKTASGKINMINSNNRLAITTLINSFGTMDISANENIPVHLFVTQEQKLTIQTSDGESQPGAHFINTFYTLDEYKQKSAFKVNPPEEKNQPAAKDKKKPKTKK